MHIKKNQIIDKFLTASKSIKIESSIKTIKQFCPNFYNSIAVVRIMDDKAILSRYDYINKLYNEKAGDLVIGKLTDNELHKLENETGRPVFSSSIIYLNNSYYSTKTIYTNYEQDFRYVYEDSDFIYISKLIFQAQPADPNIKSTNFEEIKEMQKFLESVEMNITASIDFYNASLIIPKGNDNNFYIYNKVKKKNGCYEDKIEPVLPMLSNENTASKYLTLVSDFQNLQSSYFINKDFLFECRGEIVNSNNIAKMIKKNLISDLNKIFIKNISHSSVYQLDEKTLSDSIVSYVRSKIPQDKNYPRAIRTDFNNEMFYLQHTIYKKGEGIRYFLFPDKNILILFFNCVAEYDDNGNITDIFVKYCGAYTISLYQKIRAFDESGCLVDSSYFLLEGINNSIILNTKEELTEIINSSNFSSVGVLDVWDLYGNPRELTPTTSNYLIQVVLTPAIEQLTKIFGFEYSLNLVTSSVYDINPKGTDLKSITGISKYCLKAGREKNYDFNKMQTLQYFLDKIDNVDLEKCCNYLDKINRTDLKRIAEIFNRRLSAKEFYEIADYYLVCQREQRIKSHFIIKLYRDYIEMARKLNLNLRDKSIRFPYSLNKEHDIIMKNYNLIKQEFEKKDYEEKMEYYKIYEYKEKNENGYHIVIPKTPEEIIMEGKNQHHCVASYVQYVIQGRSVILFLRKNNEPEKSLYTIEVDPRRNSVVQIRGFSNRPVTEPEIKKFLSEWETTILNTSTELIC